MGLKSCSLASLARDRLAFSPSRETTHCSLALREATFPLPNCVDEKLYSQLARVNGMSPSSKRFLGSTARADRPCLTVGVSSPRDVQCCCSFVPLSGGET